MSSTRQNFPTGLVSTRCISGCSRATNDHDHLTPGATSLDQLRQVYRASLSARLDDAARPAVERAAAQVAAAAKGGEPVYGVNTGFGKLASVKIKPMTPQRFSAT
jgi:histidine ammonia-lyase